MIVEDQKTLEKTIVRQAFIPEGSIIFKENDERDLAYILDQGRVDIYKNHGEEDEKLMASLMPGEIFGETALIDQGERTATAIASEDCLVFVLSPILITDRINNIDPLLALFISIIVERYKRSRPSLPEYSSNVTDNTAKEVVEQKIKETTKEKDVLTSLLHQQKTALQELSIEQELRMGIERKEFVPFLQPIIDLNTKKVAGFEALIRWNHPQRGLVFPNDFVSVAERTHVVQNLDHMMLEKACKEVFLLNDTAGNINGDIFVSVNLSGINFEESNLVESVAEIMRDSGVNPKQVKLEITESAFIVDPAVAERVLKELKGLGVTIALDDFGTGYSSLGYLHRFPIDVLKIDRSFIQQIETDEKGLDIVRAVVNLAHDFNLKVVAEGLEREEDVSMLQALGCEMGQGYFFGKPMDIQSAHQFIMDNADN